MTHDAAGERRTRRNDDRLNGVDNGDAGQFADPVGRKVSLGEDRRHSGDGARSFQVHPCDSSECMGRAKHIGVQHPGHGIVGDIPAAAGEETKVLQPVQGLSLITIPQPLTFRNVLDSDRNIGVGESGFASKRSMSAAICGLLL